MNRRRQLEELRDIQRWLDDLLSRHVVRIAENKLIPYDTDDAERQAIRDSFGSKDELVAAAGVPQPQTAAKYRKRGESAFAAADKLGIDVWELAESTSYNKQSWYTFKAGLQFYIVEQLRRAMQDIYSWEAAASGGAPVPRAVACALRDALRHLPELAKALAAVPSGGAPEKFTGDGKSKRHRNSKSASLKKLPADWREKVAKQMPATRRLAWLIQCVSGCRPQELVNGVEVVLRQGGALEVSVIGAKLSDRAGQPLRRLVVQANAGVALELAKMLEPEAPVQSATLVGSADAHRTAVARHCKKLFPHVDARKRPSAYSARHQFKTDIQGAGLSPTEVAQAMGHSTTKSQAHYGGGPRGRSGSVRPTQVEASRPVRARMPLPERVKAARTAVKAARRPQASVKGRKGS